MSPAGQFPLDLFQLGAEMKVGGTLSLCCGGPPGRGSTRFQLPRPPSGLVGSAPASGQPRELDCPRQASLSTGREG